ncbi:TPA: sugar ABC transporter [Serratia rubidaea]|nr:sugar ABC transporter [Serratia rubidaea]HDJ1448009.1 sugar ABC transporter [Serratia rubidaea]HDJ1462684.1 sugar ABC transporter [Serratia rubidaea]HDJ2773849.1 sugar ABC transporter [Serratia rubidaea]
MFYIVECSYNDPASEAEWNHFYSQEKLPALISVSGFRTSQRFRAVQAGCPAYLAIHTLEGADVLSSQDYRLKGGGNFARWQPYISDWHRNLYQCADPAPAVSPAQTLLFSTQPISAIEAERSYQRLDMQAVELDNFPQRRVAYVLPREKAGLLANIPGVHLYEALTVQLQGSAKDQQRDGVRRQ